MSAPEGAEPNTGDNSYTSQITQNDPIPVQKDEENIESGVNPPTDLGADGENSDEQLEKDDAEAIDKSNIIDGQTRSAKPTGSMAEPGDEEGLPGPDDGTSAIAK